MVRLRLNHGCPILYAGPVAYRLGDPQQEERDLGEQLLD